MGQSAIRSSAVAAFALLALASTQLGCQATYQTRTVEESGFLKDYSQLVKGTSDESLDRYVKPGVNWRKYTKLIMDPIQIYKRPESDLNKIPVEELQVLLHYFDATVRDHLKNDFTFVTTPGPDTLRLRIAMTEAEGSTVPLDLVSAILPYGIALANLTKVVSGKYPFVGDASIEFEVLDSTTGERLAAGVDRRAGSKQLTTGNRFASWSDTKLCYDFWAERLHNRINEFRAIN